MTQKHEEGNHGDTTNEASTQIVPEKEPETIEENPTPSYDANSPGREVSANQVETEKQDGKQDITVDKEKHDAKKSTDDSNKDGAETKQRVQHKKKNKTCRRKQKENKKGTTLDRTYLPASKQARQ